MAVPPTIPTSFVPKQPVEMHPRHSESSGNMLMVTALVLMGIAILLSIGAFAYDHYLNGVVSDKAAQLQQEQSSVSQDTVEGFLRLRDRLTSAQTVLSQHVVLSQFFDVLESLTLTDVSFGSLTITVNPDRTADLKMSGTAKSFNALAAQSAAFAAEPRIKQAIFAGITADKNGVVSFTLSATLDPSLVQLPATVPSSWTSVAPTDTASSTAATTTTP